MTKIEYLKERIEVKEYWKDRNASEEPLSDYQRITALQNACPCCYAIRSVLEIQDGTCYNCG